LPHLTEHLLIENREDSNVLNLISADRMNRLSLAAVMSLTWALDTLEQEMKDQNPKPLIVCGSRQYFSVGADLNEIARLNAADAFDFAKAGQQLMNRIDEFPAPVYAAISGYCMGGGLDLALSCDIRICAPEAVFGHRGAALGLITGWGGTQRLSNLVGRARALQMFTAGERLQASAALKAGLVTEIAADPLMRCATLIAQSSNRSRSLDWR
jgi:enoyl-CoA hydratase/carnithine racemase